MMAAHPLRSCWSVALSAVGATVSTGLLLLGGANVHAAEWRFGAQVATDVSTVTERTEDVDDDTRTTLTVAPSLTLARTGRRFAMNGNIGVAYRQSLDGEGEELSPRIGLRSAVALNERTLTFETELSSTLSDTSPIAVGGTAAADDAGNIAGEAGEGDAAIGEPDSDRFSRVDRLSLGPIWRGTLGERTQANAAYRFSVDHSDDDRLSTTRQHSVSFASRSWVDDARETSVLTSLGADRADADDVAEATSTVVLVSLRRSFGARLGVQAGVGYDRLTVDASIDADDATGVTELEESVDESGPIYSVGGYWQPIRQVIAGLTYTDRSFGQDARGVIRFEGRRAGLALEWRRGLALESAAVDPFFPSAGDDQLTVEVDGGIQGDEPAPVTPVEGLSTPADDRALFGRDLSAVTETISLDWTRDGRVSTVGLGIDYQRRESIGRGGNLSGTGFSAGFGRMIGRSARFTISARHTIDDDTAFEMSEVDDGSSAGSTRRTRFTAGVVISLR